MDLSGPFGRLVALIGDATVLLRHRQGVPEPAFGEAPSIPAAKPQGTIPTLKMPTAQGWAQGQAPLAAPGLAVNAFAAGLDHPRWIEALPNGDVLVAESTSEPGPVKNLFGYAMSLDEEHRNRLRDRIRSRLPVRGNGTISLVARAWAARGSVSSN